MFSTLVFWQRLPEARDAVVYDTKVRAGGPSPARNAPWAAVTQRPAKVTTRRLDPLLPPLFTGAVYQAVKDTGVSVLRWCGLCCGVLMTSMVDVSCVVAFRQMCKEI
jgi:hypothetical protein